MADIDDLYRILYVVYKANYEGKIITVIDLQNNDELRFMHRVRKLVPSLLYLRKANYVEGPDGNLQLTGKGLKTIETIFQKFLIYMRKNYYDELSHWIKTLEPLPEQYLGAYT